MNPNKQFCIGKIINYTQCKSQMNALDQKGNKRFNTSGNQTQISRAARYSQALNQPSSIATRILNDPVVFQISSVFISQITTSSCVIYYEGYYNQVIIQRNGVQVYKGNAAKYIDIGLEPNTMYNYTVISCKTDNVLGDSYSSSVVTLPTLESMSFSNIGPYSVTINYQGSFYGVIIKRNGAQVYSGTDSSFNDTSVQPNISYTYQVIPYNINNLIGADITNSVVTLPYLDSLTYSEVTYDSITVNYTGIFSSVIINRDGAQVYIGSDTSFNDIDVSANTTYTYQVIPYNTSNVMGNDVSSSVVTLPYLTSLTYSYIMPYFIKLNYTGIFSSVIINRDGTQIYSGPNTSFNDIDLSANVTYTYQVIPYNMNNVIGSDVSSSIVTLAYIDSLYYTDISYDSITVNYTGIYSSVIINRDDTQIYSGSDTSFNDIDLSANTTYTYQVIPYNTSNIMGSGVSSSIVTLPYLDSLYYTDISYDSITVNYAGYFYSVIINRDGSQIYSGSDTSFNDIDLSANTTYNYQVISYNINNLMGNDISSSIVTLPVIYSLYYTDISYDSITVNYTGSFNSVIINRDGTQVYSGSDVSFNDIDLSANTSYNYQVIPYNYSNMMGTDISSNISTL